MTLSRLHSAKMSVGSARFYIAIFLMVCYTIVATQLNIATLNECIFILVKMHSLLSHSF